MTNLNILEAKRESNKWLKELTESENLLLIDMMEEARELGYSDGQKDAHSSFSDVCEQHGFKQLLLTCIYELESSAYYTKLGYIVASHLRINFKYSYN